ncbi:MAG: hypothetical protein RQ761_03585 [Bacteroidales bacterium]|nr:hypothetical protein [Bacteroidales bacterium]
MLPSCYQMRVEVHQLPSNTPESADIYITGEFNNWDPGDSRYILKQAEDSIYYLNLPRGVGELEYKFTRGDWTTVEKDNCGYEIDNRVLKYGGEDEVVTDTIRSWADLDPVDCDQMTFVITSLPENTPQDAPITLAGNINNWDVEGNEYIFETKGSGNKDGSLNKPVLTIYRPGDLEEIEFKITRGSLNRSEADGLGREIKPRTIRFGQADTVFIEVESWQDLEKAKGNMITLIVQSIPENTPPEDAIFFVGEINDWYPHDGNLRLEKNRQGQYFINLPKRAYNKEYKFTRGNWRTVETDKYGYEINNRVLKKAGSSDTVTVAIHNWADLSEEIPGKIQISISGLPENTPPDAGIYLAGNFNNWNPGNPDWKLQQDSISGTYFISIPRDRNMLEFKFTRGSWNTVEADEYGDDIPNRVYRYSDVDSLQLEVVSWKDLQ